MLELKEFSKKICLGTAQFSNKPYSVKNKSKILSTKGVGNIIKCAKTKKIFFLDCSENYTGSIEKISKIKNLKKFKIIFKISSPKKISSSNYELFQILNLQKILKKLKIKRFYAIMLHDCRNLSISDINKIKNLFKIIKKKKISNLFGVSIYSQSEFFKINRYIKISVVQGPINFFDRTLLKNGFLKLLKKKNIKFFARSIFLQGVLLQKTKNLNSFFYKWNKQFKDFENFCAQNKLTKIEACLSYIKKIKYIDYIVIGVLSSNEIKNILNTRLVRTIKFKDVNFGKNKNLLFYPFNWKLK